MATYTIYSSIDDGQVDDINITPYSSLDVDGASLPSPNADTTSTFGTVDRKASGVPDYDLGQLFFLFDASELFSPTTCTFTCEAFDGGAQSGTQTLRLLDHDWTAPLSVNDFLGSSSFGSYTNLGTFSIAEAATQATKTISISNPGTVLNSTGTTGLHLVCDNQATQPTDGVDETDIDVLMADSAGTTDDPYITGTDADPDSLVPDSDNSLGGWTDDGGGTTNIYTAIDEATPSDTDYVQSAQSPSTDTLKVGLSNPTVGVDTNELVKIAARYQKSVASETINLVIKLIEGASTVRATWTINDISDAWVEASYTLSAGEKAAVTDWDNLFLQFEATQA